MRDLFEYSDKPAKQETIPLASDAFLFKGLLRDELPNLLDEIAGIAQQAPFRHLITPGGHRMSVAMTNCGPLGWISDRSKYRYTNIDPLTQNPWPPLPALFLEVAKQAAAKARFDHFIPDACLINRYEPGAKLSLHQDREEEDLVAPIVSVSLGLPAIFLFGGLQRNDKTTRYRVEHGDVAVWGGASRFAYHGIAPLADGEHPTTGKCRLNITFRKVQA